MSSHEFDPRFVQGVDMVRRTGALEVQVRFDEEQSPIVWIAAVRHHIGPDSRPVRDGVTPFDLRWTVAADLDPLGAVMKVCEELIDGGMCAHCGRPSAFDATAEAWNPVIDALLCVTQWDPELAVFRRGCEGDVE